ncbi:MAG: hypothetical protein B6245_15690 [Desulfobacteraceae bacterium 4572_88]|nr:MAG: hypothetical protein B6245_15690 [Desulfobacteraceae bacterium 4572_88]
MKEKIKETLYHVAEDVLEKLAFIFSFPEDERESIDYEAAVAVRVSFDGPFSGTLILALSTEALPELAGNMLGLDDVEETTVADQHDALKELINVICGNLLPAISGKQSIFNVDTPEILGKDDSIADHDRHDPIAIAKLDLDEVQCDLLLFVDGDISTEQSENE